jgi:hypothetical protein
VIATELSSLLRKKSAAKSDLVDFGLVLAPEGSHLFDYCLSSPGRSTYFAVEAKSASGCADPVHRQERLR